MADYLPQNSGLWSTTTWITAFSNLTALAGGNTPPTVIDDVYADGKTITVDINTSVRSIRNTTSPRTGGLTGGSFTLNNGITLIANVITATTAVICVNYNGTAGNSASLSGNIIGGGASGAYGISNNSTGTLNVSGSVTGGPGTNAHGIHNASSGIVNIAGNVIGGGASGCYGVRNLLGGIVNITGNVTGGTGGSDGAYNTAGGTVTIRGNVNSGGTSGASIGATNAGTGTLSITGNITAGTINNAYGVFHSANGIVNITGAVTGGTAAGTHGVMNNSTGTIYISGDVTGGSGAGASGCLNVTTGTVYISGNAIGGSNATDSGGIIAVGAQNSAGGSIFINGTAIPSSVVPGARNQGNGLLYVTKAIGNQFGLGSVGINSVVGLANNSQNGRVYVEQVEFGPRGATPISGPVYILPSNRNTLTGYTTALGTPVTFYNSLSVSNLLPPVSSVQAGVVYNVGNSVGAMTVPSASAVQFGVPVDNTTGTAALQPQDVWGYARLSATEVDSMGDRLRNTATTQSIGYQIASFNL